MLEQQDFTVVRLPLIAVEPSNVPTETLNALDGPPAVDWMIFISVNAVNFALTGNNGKIREHCLKAKVAAVGQATAKALQQAGIEVSLVPEQGFNSEALLSLLALQQLQCQRCVIVRGVGGRELLAETLRALGAQVDYLEVYRRQPFVGDLAGLIALLRRQALDVITLTSAEALQALTALLPTQPERDLLFACPLVVISDRLGLMASNLGFKSVTVSEGVGDSAVFKTIINLVNGEDSG
jgi:uroporphyrinogen-III synthase